MYLKICFMQNTATRRLLTYEDLYKESQQCSLF